jgi:hypothetical protein
VTGTDPDMFIYNFHMRPPSCILRTKALKGANSSAEVIWFLFRLMRSVYPKKNVTCSHIYVCVCVLYIYTHKLDFA